MKKLDKISKPLNCFRSIDDLPIKAWFKIHENGDYRSLMKEVVKIDSSQFEDLFIIWQEIYNQYIERFGLSEEFLEDLNNQIQLGNYKAEFIISGERYLKTLIKVEEAKIAFDKKSDSKPVELEMLLARMSKYYGFKLESRELTVVQYYSYLNVVKNG